jgi:hypothetical protein
MFGMLPQVPAAAAALDVLAALGEVAALDVLAALAEVAALAGEDELDEPDEQAARPRPAARARAVMPPVCTALIEVSFDTVVAVAYVCFG